MYLLGFIKKEQKVKSKKYKNSEGSKIIKIKIKVKRAGCHYNNCWMSTSDGI